MTDAAGLAATPSSQPIFGLNDKPPALTTGFAALQHMLAVFGGIITAPLIIASGMGLNLEQSNQVITSALFISGCATLLQISRIGAFGSGLLAIQGTSFTFIGAILFAFHGLPDSYSTENKLAVIFGTCAVASVLMLPLGFGLRKLKRLFSPAVTGGTVVLLGTSLVASTLSNLQREWQQAAEPTLVLLFAGIVFATTAVMSLHANPWVRMSSIVAGLGVGFMTALFLGQVEFSALNDLPLLYIPTPLHYGLDFHWSAFFVLMPVFLVTATESVGDLTATQALSRLPMSGPGYWDRIRGGILGDAVNSALAALFSTFPNTTFSQNNGVIRITGIASRHVGYVVAIMLIVLGLCPLIAGVFQVVPGAVIYGATVLMFALVIYAGVNILRAGCIARRDWWIAGIAVGCGWLLSSIAAQLTWLPESLRMILQFPVSTGAFAAMLAEIVLPGKREPSGAQVSG